MSTLDTWIHTAEGQFKPDLPWNQIEGQRVRIKIAVHPDVKYNRIGVITAPCAKYNRNHYHVGNGYTDYGLVQFNGNDTLQFGDRDKVNLTVRLGQIELVND